MTPIQVSNSMSAQDLEHSLLRNQELTDNFHKEYDDIKQRCLCFEDDLSKKGAVEEELNSLKASQTVSCKASVACLTYHPLIHALSY